MQIVNTTEWSDQFFPLLASIKELADVYQRRATTLSERIKEFEELVCAHACCPFTFALEGGLSLSLARRVHVWQLVLSDGRDKPRRITELPVAEKARVYVARDLFVAAYHEHLAATAAALDSMLYPVEAAT